MGRVRTKTVKKSSRQVIERYYSRMTLDFHTNKKILEEVAIIPSKRLRNKIAGFSTHLMKRIQRGPVRGISLKLQEEERERRMDFVPEKSAIKTEDIEVDKETMEMLAALGMSDLPGIIKQAEVSTAPTYVRGGGGGAQGGRRPETLLSSLESSSSLSSSDEQLFRRQVELLHEYGKMMIEMGEAEEKEQEATSSWRRGGSKRGRIDKRKSREHKLGEDSLNRDYFDDNPRFKGISFRRRFRMSEGVY
ncbi:hypothetical protein GIB67_034982 [Kingdonia uniflora]|uniref:40S ribosomal protein S17 n=1 Tax=Kingdonia uniflora TaxID=39325 RepID=A0A7J7NGR6_9MAGN|nr:hypothetical protein GIB67_034982 [Kingdonia uniflora]